MFLGALSEEPQEVRNKDFKKFRSSFSRKSSRKDTLVDIFNRFLLTSDPVFFKILQDFTKNRRQRTKRNPERRPLVLIPETGDEGENDDDTLQYDSSEDEQTGEETEDTRVVEVTSDEEETVIDAI